MGIASFTGLPRITWEPDQFFLFVRDTLRGSPLATVEKKPRLTSAEGYWLDVAFQCEGRRIASAERGGTFVPYTDALRVFALLADCPFLYTSGLSRALCFRERKNLEQFVMGIKSLAGTARPKRGGEQRAEFVLTEGEQFYLSIYSMTCGEWRFAPFQESSQLWRCALKIGEERSTVMREFAHLGRRMSQSDTPVFRTREEAEFFMREFERVAREVHAGEENWTREERERGAVENLSLVQD